MTAYDRLHALASDNYGLVMVKAAMQIGISNMSLVILVRRGRIEPEKILSYGDKRIGD